MKKITKQRRIVALTKSITHWQDDYPKHCDFGKGKFAEGMKPSPTNCALCGLYNCVDTVDCNQCPVRYCNRPGAYSSACDALARGDRPAFMHHRRNLIRRMQRALRREMEA